MISIPPLPLASLNEMGAYAHKIANQQLERQCRGALGAGENESNF